MSAEFEESSVLLIDHDSETRKPLRQRLQNRGHSVVALPDVPRTPFDYRRHDVVLFDLNSGFEALACLRRDAPDTPIVVLTGAQGSTADAVRAFKLGASDYLIAQESATDRLEQALRLAVEQGRQWRREQAYLKSLEQTNERLRGNLEALRDDEEAGRRLQFQLLPPDRQSIGPYRFSRRLCTSLYLSGDFVDYFRIDDEHTGFYMADVAGHGVSSAIVTVLLKSYMARYLELYRRAKNQGILDPARIFTRINHNMLKSGMDKHLTMFYGVLNNTTQTLYYCNAGQFPYPILYGDDTVQYIESRSKPLGMFDFAEYHTRMLPLTEKFTLAIVSDGILELLPQSNTNDKLLYLLGAVANEPTSITALSRGLGLDTVHNTLQDDVTLLLVQRGL